tara:strand:+ start:110 stop:466 length:357 start_codon:yes stop_codon:yes gene_type:complete
MNHQDWNQVTFNTKIHSKKNLKKHEKKDEKKDEKKNDSEQEIKLVVPKNLPLLISQARTTKNKTQKILANELGVSVTIVNKWESNKELPTNSDIVKIENNLGIKLPRIKKIKENNKEL